MAILEHFMFNSDYPTEKIVFMDKGEMTLPSESWESTYVLINTHIKTMAYIDGDYSVGNSSTRWPLSNNTGGRDGAFAYSLSFMYKGECWIYVGAMAFSVGVGKKLSFRVWGYCDEEESKNADIGTTANSAKPMIVLTSDRDYPKFIGSAFIAPGQTYSHNLGFAPKTRAWCKDTEQTLVMPDGGTFSGDVFSMSACTPYFGNPETYSDPFRGTVLQVSDSSIVTYNDGSGYPAQWYIRMYEL